MSDKQEYFYRRHPVLTLMLFVLLATAAFLKIADKVLYARAKAKTENINKTRKDNEPAWVSSPINRVVRLREIRPFTNGYVQPTKEYLQLAENLEDKKYWINLDENGFISVNDSTWKQNSSPIVFLGGSTTECLYVTEEKRFPHLAAKQLSQALSAEVKGLNGGVSGNHSMHANNILLNKVIPLQPKVVVLMECVNDLNILLYEGTYWNKNLSRSMVLDTAMLRAYNSQFPKENYTAEPVGWLKNVYPYLSMRYGILKSKLLPTTQQEKTINEWSGIEGKRLTINKQKVEADYRSSLISFVGICKAWNITPVLMTQQNRLTETPDEKILAGMKNLAQKGIDYNTYRSQYITFNNIIREVAADYQVKLIDLDKLVPKKSEYIYDAVHVNDKGSELIAETISKELAPIFND